MTRTALAALALLAGVLASGPGCRADNPAAADEDGQVLPVANSVEADDYDLDIAGATVIALDTGSITVFGEGVEVAGTRARITRAGTYLAQGTLADGQIEIDAGAAAKVKLILDGVNITTSDDAPILVRNAAKAVLYLPPDTVNTLTDGAASTRDGAIHCKTRLAIFGPGRRPPPISPPSPDAAFTPSSEERMWTVPPPIVMVAASIPSPDRTMLTLPPLTARDSSPWMPSVPASIRNAPPLMITLMSLLSPACCDLTS